MLIGSSNEHEKPHYIITRQHMQHIAAARGTQGTQAAALPCNTPSSGPPPTSSASLPPGRHCSPAPCRLNLVMYGAVIGGCAYVYMRWKGLRVSDLMYVTRSSLSAMKQSMADSEWRWLGACLATCAWQAVHGMAGCMAEWLSACAWQAVDGMAGPCLAACLHGKQRVAQQGSSEDHWRPAKQLITACSTASTSTASQLLPPTHPAPPSANPPHCPPAALKP